MANNIKNVLLKLSNIKKVYRMDGISIKALDGISLMIREGEFVAITGASGSGKSTLMHIIGCLDTPTNGEVFLEGQKVSDLTERQLAIVRNKKIGFVFQQFNLLARTSALENVALPLIYSSLSESEIEEKAKEALNMVGLSNRLDHQPNQLSGGQQQKVAIARALVTSPSLILADEPTGNLDSKSGQEILKIFQQLNNQGNTIILVTHNQQVAANAQRIIKIKDGKIEEK